MRLNQVWLSLVLGPAMLSGQQTSVPASQKPAQSHVAKPSVRPSAPQAEHSAARTRHARTAYRKPSKRPDYRPEYADNTVEVINGSSTSKVVFHTDQSSATPVKKLPSTPKGALAPMKVEVLNGTSTDTQYFYNSGEDQTTARNQPVVVDVQSSDTHVSGGNKHPVVTTVTSSSVNDAKTASGHRPPVTANVSPRPRRPPYQQDVH